MLPAYIRQEVERRLFENGFRDYDGLAQWVRGQGYEISDDSLWRYGHNLQQQLAPIRLSLRLAGELAQDHEALMARALITIAQQKALATLAEKEEVTPADLNAVANLTRAAIAQQRWGAELKEAAEQQQRAADGTIGLPDKIQPNHRNARRAIATLQDDHTALAASAEPTEGSNRPCEASPSDESHPPAKRHPPETTIAVEGKAITSFAADIQPVLHRGSPRIAVDLTGPEAKGDARFEFQSA